MADMKVSIESDQPVNVQFGRVSRTAGGDILEEDYSYYPQCNQFQVTEYEQECLQMNAYDKLNIVNNSFSLPANVHLKIWFRPFEYEK
jgi:hypothetical protein